MQNRVMNIKMEKSNKSALAHFPQAQTWLFLITINTPVLGTQNELTGTRVPIVPYESGVQVPQKHVFRETFEREKVDGDFFGKGEWDNLVNRLCKFQSHNFFYFIICYPLFYTNVKAMDHLRVENSPNPVFMWENNLKTILYPV